MTNLQSLKNLAKKTVPSPMYRWLGSQLNSNRDRPPVGQVDFGNLRRLTPISRQFGYDRGQPVGRYYVENFLARHAAEVRGHVLEIGDAAYTRRFGGDLVTASDVFHAVEGNPEATYVGDLSTADFIPSNTFDCFILTQTLLLIYDLPAAFETIYRILKPGGVVLATLTGISQMVGEPWEANQCWSFTPVSARRMFEAVFPPGNVANIGAAFCRHIHMDEAGHWHYISQLEQSESGVLENWLEKIAVRQRIQTPSIVVRREVYEQLGGFDRRIRYWGEDWEMWVRIASQYPVWYEIEPLALYRTHSNSLSGHSVRTGANIQDFRKAIGLVKEYLPADRANQ